MILNMVCYNSAGGDAIPYFTYSGRCMLKNDGNGNWRIGFITSGVFIPSTDIEVDLFLCGAGAGGQSGKRTSTVNAYGKGGNDGGSHYGSTGYSTYAGHGGGGGYTATHKSITLIKGVEYPVIIGAGGAKDSAGGQSSFGSYIALGGDGAVATSNTDVNGGSNGSPGQGTTTREFEEETGELYSGAGGAGGSWRNSVSYAGGAGGAGGYTDDTKGGGAYGYTTTNSSGKPGDVSETWGFGGGRGGNAAGNASGGGGGGGIGAGGGGGANSGAAGGAGAQGIVIIRNAHATV